MKKPKKMKLKNGSTINLSKSGKNLKSLGLNPYKTVYFEPEVVSSQKDWICEEHLKPAFHKIGRGMCRSANGPKEAFNESKVRSRSSRKTR